MDSAAGLAAAHAGINADNVHLLSASLPLADIHASCSEPLPAPKPMVAALGFDSGSRRRTSRAKVASLMTKLRA